MSKDSNTFFPSSWTIEQLISEMRVAMLNPIKVKKTIKNRILVIGESTTGIRIKMIFEKQEN